MSSWIFLNVAKNVSVGPPPDILLFLDRTSHLTSMDLRFLIYNVEIKAGPLSEALVINRESTCISIGPEEGSMQISLIVP